MAIVLAVVLLSGRANAQTVTTTTSGTWDTLGSSFDSNPYTTSSPWNGTQFIRAQTNQTPSVTSNAFSFTPVVPVLPAGAISATLLENRISMNGLVFRPDDGGPGDDPNDFATYSINGTTVANLFNNFTTTTDANPVTTALFPGTTFMNLVNSGGNPTNAPVFLITTGFVPIGTANSFNYSIDFVQNNSANANTLLFDGEANLLSPTAGVTGLVFNVESDWDFVFAPPVPPEPIFLVTDIAAIEQLSSSAIPMNIAVGGLASEVHRTGLRNFNQRIHRLRDRTAGNGGPSLGQTSPSARPGRVVSASRFYRMRRAIEVEHTIHTEGYSPSGDSGVSAGGNDRASRLHDGHSLLPTVTQEAELYYHDTYGRRTTPSGSAFDRWETFASVDFGDYDVHALGNSPGLDSRTYAANAGLEYTVNSCLALGTGWSHVMNDNTLENGGGAVDLEGDAVVGYASYFNNNLWADILYGYGNYGADISRNTLGSIVRAQPRITSHQSSLNLGYNFPCGDRFVHGPTMRADYNWGELDGYTETGNVRANTTFGAQEFESLIAAAGWQFNWRHDTPWGALRPQIRAGYARENIDGQTRVTGTLQNSPFALVQGNVVTPGGAFGNTLTHEVPGEEWLEVGVGVGLDFRNNFSLLIDYQGRFLQDNAQVHLGSVHACWVY